jgi:hypothetical protein
MENHDHVIEEEADYKTVAASSELNQNPNYTDIDTAANDPFNYPPAKKMIECMTQVGVNPQADLKLCLYHTYKSPKTLTGGANKRRRSRKRKSKRRRKQRKTRRK